MSLHSDSIVKRTAGLMSTRVGEEIYVLNPVADRYTGLDDIGRRIWDLLETTTQISSLRDRVVQEYEGDPRQIATDVMEFLNDLQTEGLLEVQ
jgi:hypothetical protein